MPQRAGVHRTAKPCRVSVLLHQPLDRTRRQSPRIDVGRRGRFACRVVTDEERWGVVAPELKVLGNPLAGLLGNRHEPQLALAAVHGQLVTVREKLFTPERCDFRNP